MLPLVEPFSGGYYLINDLDLVPADTDVPRVDDHLYGHLQDEFYGDAQTPILFRVGRQSTHFGIEPGADVASTVLELPPAVIDRLGEAPDAEPILMAKPGHAHQIVRLYRLAETLEDRTPSDIDHGIDW